MKKLLLTIAAAIFAAALLPGRTPVPGAPFAGMDADLDEDTIVIDSLDSNAFNAMVAFIEMPAQTLDLLNTSSRLDLLDYYAADSIANVVNSMDGLSHLVRPLTENYLKVQVTPVTTLAIKILPFGKQKIAAISYTIGDSLQAADSDLKFFDENMTELNRTKFITPATTGDFFNFRGVDSKTRKELLDLVPFPTVEYTFDPATEQLHARLTSGEFLGKETVKKISPYLRRDRVYNWDGKKFKLLK